MNNSSDKIFIYPTDTVWGIGSSIYSKVGYEKIAEIKKSSTDKPLSIMFSSVEDVIRSFELPKDLSVEWLREFFLLETTLGLPLKLAKIKIPQWATGESTYVSLRCLETNAVQAIYNEIQKPFFTTSLNISGFSPITNFNEAIEFQEKYAPDAQLITSNLDQNPCLSGSSSTIIFFNENLKYEIKREGKRIEDVKKHLLKLSIN